MKIDLRNKKEIILSTYSIESLYERFAGVSKGKIYCPFHKDDKPSMSIRHTKFKCFGCNKVGDIFDFIMYLYGVNFAECLNIILDAGPQLKKKSQEETVKEEISELTYKVTEYKDKHLEYWEKYYIDKYTLNKYKVSPLKVLLKGDYPLYVDYKDNLAFLYKFKRGYKVYMPLVKSFYSKGNCIQGLEQLDFSNKTLIITKSLKDVMFFSTIGYNAIAPPSENTFISNQVMVYLMNRFKVIINFDNDLAGIKASNYYTERYGLPSIISPTKDFTDMVKLEGKLKTINQIQKCLEELK